MGRKPSVSSTPPCTLTRVLSTTSSVAVRTSLHMLYQFRISTDHHFVADNPGCGTKGFSAVKGWDPVTGLGTPKFDDLLKIFLKLQ